MNYTISAAVRRARHMLRTRLRMSSAGARISLGFGFLPELCATSETQLSVDAIEVRVDRLPCGTEQIERTLLASCSEGRACLGVDGRRETSRTVTAGLGDAGPTNPQTRRTQPGIAPAPSAVACPASSSLPSGATATR
jgi:hypothetical protein